MKRKYNVHDTNTFKGKTMKDRKLRFYSTMTVMVLYNGKEWAVKKEDTTNI